ncbi:MAG: acyltransferase family protein [Marinilabiliaceae bacterium]
MIGHVVDGYIEAGSFPDCLSIEFFIWQVLYAFHMPLFFIVSGFVFSKAYGNPDGSVKTAKLRAQLLDIAAVYIFFSFVLCAFKVLFSGHVNSPLGFTDMLGIWKSPISLYWYLYVLAAFYVICVPLLRSGRRLFIGSLVVTLAVSLASGWLRPPSLFCIDQMAFLLVFFLFGAAVQRGYVKIDLPLASAGLGLSAVLFCVFYDSHTPPFDMAVNYRPFINTIVAAGVSIFVFKAFSAFSWLDKPFLRLCGKYCLGIYVIHCFFTAGFRTLLPIAGVTAFWPSFILNVFLSTAISLLIPMALARIGLHDAVFRPAHWLTKRRETKRKEPAPARH